MNNFKKIITGAVASTLVVLGLSMFALAPTANAIPWSSSSTGLTKPGFNVFTGVPNYGNESDFMRGRVSGSSNAFTNPVNDACATGTQYSVQMYVHNGANQTLNNNGSGPGVAHGTTVKVGVPGTTANDITGTVSANNATSVSDTLNINCNGKTMQLSYVKGTAIEQHMDGSTSALSDNIVTTGAPIDTHGVSGDVWGCFEQRVIVYLKVEVKEVPTPPASSGECRVADLYTSDNRSVKVSVTGQATNAQIVGYEINWGDGTANSNKQTDTHTYAKDGTYTIVTKVQVKFPDGHTEWKTAEACTKQVTFKSGTPTTPVVVTTSSSLPNTGAGDLVGIFVATTVAGMIAYRFVWLRKFGQ